MMKYSILFGGNHLITNRVPSELSFCLTSFFFYAKMKILQNRKSNMRLKALNDVPNEYRKEGSSIVSAPGN
jgi:hypothetical protein